MKGLLVLFLNFVASPHHAISIRTIVKRLITGLMGSLCYVARCALGPRLARRGLPPFGRHHFAALMRVLARYAGFRTSLAFAILSLGIISCQINLDQTKWKEYYFPTDEMEDGLVYIYEVVSQDSIYEDIWFYKSILEDTASYFTAQQYDQDFNVTRFQLYRLTDWGAELERDIAYTTDSMGLAVPHESEVLEVQSFKFGDDKVKASFLSAIRYENIEDSGTFLQRSTREYLRDTSFMYNDKVYPAILIGVKESTEYDKSERSDVTHTVEMYAQDFGLVHFVKNNPKKLELNHTLDTIYEMQDFLKVRFSE